MATANALVARLEAVTPEYRVAPNNIDAEQALLGRHPRQQRRLLPRLRLPRAGAFLRGAAPAHLRGGDEPHQGRQGRDADHPEDLSRRRRPRRHHRLAIPRPPRRRGDDRHQRRGLRPHDLRPRHPAQPDRHRRGHGQRRLRRAGRDLAARPDRGGRAPPLRACRDGPLRRRLPALLRRPHAPPSTWRPPPTSATASCPASPPACATSTATMGGLQPSDLVILAGRPGMGKTSLATNIAFNIAKAYRGREAAGRHASRPSNGGIVGFFSLEMSAEQLATRIIAEQSGVPSFKIRRGDIREDDFYKITEAARDMQTMPFYIDQTGGISIAQLAARARRLKRQRGLDVLVVDYLQLLSGSAEEGRQPRPGADRDHHRPQGPGQGAQRADPGPVAALAPGRGARRQAAATLGPARVGLDRAGRRRGACSCSARNTI